MDAITPVRRLILRIKFRNGTVREKMGSEAIVDQLFEKDEEHLIDYVQGLDPGLNEFAIWLHEDDARWEGIQL